jgi:hypothetical protein
MKHAVVLIGALAMVGIGASGAQGADMKMHACAL